MTRMWRACARSMICARFAFNASAGRPRSASFPPSATTRIFTSPCSAQSSPGVPSLQLALERGDGLVQHAPVRVGPGGASIGAGSRKRQLERLPVRGPLALLRCQRAAEGLLPFGLGLLELDVFALEAAG